MEGTRAWCNRIIEGLLAAGVSDLVVSPGSRSTPFLLAALQSSLQLHSIVDERSAAFFALGRTRKTGAPIALLCTSGSAGAHYLPALLEARYAGHRLIALTADRPPQLRDCGANQTIDQRQLFAAACPPCLELGMPDSNGQALDAVRRRVFESVSLAPGPLHFNLAFRKPLEPESGEKGQRCEPFSPQPLRRPDLRAHQEALRSIQHHCEKSKAIVVIAGPSEYGLADTELLASELALLAEATGAALLAESTSGARFVGTIHRHRIDSFTHVLSQDTAAQELAPDLILQFGVQPSSASLNRWLAEQNCTTVRMCDSVPYNSPDGSAQVVMGNLVDLCRRIRDVVTPSSDTTYVARWREWDELTQRAVEAEITDTASAFSEAQAMAAILSHLPAACQVTIGNSLAIRTADMVLSGSEKRLDFLHQRGTSGIEGLIAAAIGSSSESLSALILGDVSASHDSASLALAALCQGPLVILCIDNEGGQIFSHLPVKKLELDGSEWQYWQTTPRLNWQALCVAYQVGYRISESAKELADSLHWASTQEGCVFLHTKVAAEGLLQFQENVAARIQRGPK